MTTNGATATNAMKAWTDRSGRTWQSDRPRPFVVVVGAREDDRYFGSLAAAVKAAPDRARVFFESEPGVGRFIGYAHEIAREGER